MEPNWEDLLDPYIQAVGELKIKLRGIRKQYRKQNLHSPIEFVTGRVKPIESIQEKMVIRAISMERLEQDMQDIAGLRIMVQFVDDVYEILEVLRRRKDMRIVQERDYINHRKSSGYRSYHVVSLIRLFWATIEHSLNYKYKGNFPEEIKNRLERAARMAYQLDEEMGQIRDDIQDAQALFDPVHRKLYDGVGNSDDTDEEYR